MHDRIDEIEDRLNDIEKRLKAIEGESATPSQDSVGLGPSLGEGFVATASTHIGGVLLIFGGAYLLRAITDFQFVPTTIGILLGATYALFWLYMAYSKGAIDSQRGSAVLYGGTSIVLALPLLVEAISRFELLTGTQGVAALLMFAGLALGVATARNLRSLAWLTVGGTIATALFVIVATHVAVGAAALLVALGIASLWTVYQVHWLGLQWLGAIGANAGAMTLVALCGSDQWDIEALTVAWFGTGLMLTYLVSFTLRSHVFGRNLGSFEIIQTLATAGIALWAARTAAAAGQLSLAPFGILSFGLGVAAYIFAFGRHTRGERGPNFYYYSSFGLLLIVAGTALALPPVAAATLWSVMAVAMAWSSGRTGWVALSLQCTVLLLAAGFQSGLLATGLQALAGAASPSWPALLPWHIGIALATVACLFLPVAQHSVRWGAAAGLPQLLVLALSVWEVGGLMVVVAGQQLADAAGKEPDLAVLAALRTAVLAASSVTLAFSSRFRRWPEARWLVYPVLTVVGLKLFLEDFPRGEPATLFVALAFVGGALLLVAKLLSSGRLPPVPGARHGG